MVNQKNPNANPEIKVKDKPNRYLAAAGLSFPLASSDRQSSRQLLGALHVLQTVNLDYTAIVLSSNNIRLAEIWIDGPKLPG